MMKILSGEKLIFFPGLDGTGMSYEPLSKFISEDADVTVVHYPKSKNLTFQEIVSWASKQTSSIEGAVVIAESFSGPIAIELIGSGKLKAKCLVLCATFARSPRPPLLKALRYFPLAKMMGFHIPDSLLKSVFGGSEFSETLLPFFHRIREIVSPEVFAYRLKMLSHIDVRKWLPKLSLPCSYIQATKDLAVPPSAMIDFIENIKHLNVKRIKGPHFIIQSKPEQSAKAIAEFNDLTTKNRADTKN